jgi:hypothetical protein
MKKETPENRGRRKEKKKRKEKKRKSLIEGSCQRSSKFDGVNMGEIS